MRDWRSTPPIDAPMTASLAPATNRWRAKWRHLSTTGSGIAPFKMKPPKKEIRLAISIGYGGMTLSENGAGDKRLKILTKTSDAE
jgi:hypothetical protein